MWSRENMQIDLTGNESKKKFFLLKTSDQFEGTIEYLGFKQVSSP